MNTLYNKTLFCNLSVNKQSNWFCKIQKYAAWTFNSEEKQKDQLVTKCGGPCGGLLTCSVSPSLHQGVVQTISFGLRPNH